MKTGQNMLLSGVLHHNNDTRAREKSVKRRRKIWLAPKKSLTLHRKSRLWRNWQTRQTQDLVFRDVQVRVLSGAQQIPTAHFERSGLFLWYWFNPQLAPRHYMADHALSYSRPHAQPALQGERGIICFVTTVHTGFCCILRARIVSSQSLLIQQCV